MTNGLYFPFVDFLSTAATAIVLGYGGYLYFGNDLTIGTLLAFMLYLSNFFDPVQQLSQLYNTFLAAVAALDKITEVLDEEPEILDAPDAARPPRDPGARPLRGRPFRLRQGRRGPARHRPGRAGRDDGRARRAHRRREVHDREAPGALLRPARGPHHHRRPRPPRRSRRRACAASSASSRRRASSSRARFGRTSPSGGRTRPRRRSRPRRARSARTTSSRRSSRATRPRSPSAAARLSLGQRQLVAFARALLADPRILVLDEATSSVDIGTERRIELALRTLLAGRTAFIIAHRLSTIRSADLIVVLEHGRVVEQGTHDELLRARGLYLSLYGDWASAAA